MEARFALLSAKTLSSTAPASPGAVWSLREGVGRLIELSGRGASAQLTAAFALVLEAQQRHEPVAWVTLRASSFYPPDAAAGGVDLASLVVVRVKTAPDAARAADQLVRSDGFGLVVIDLVSDRSVSVPPPLLTRLLGLAQKCEAAIIFLTEKREAAPSLSSLVSLRADVSRVPRGEGTWEVVVAILKDKRRGPGAMNSETCVGPPGLR